MFIYTYFVVAVLIGFFLNSLVVFGVCKLFAVKDISYKRSLIITVAIFMLELVLAIMTRLLSLGLVGSVISIVASVISMHYILKYYSHASWLKSIGIFFTICVFALIISIAILLPLRIFIFEPFVVVGNSMSPALNPGAYFFVEKYDKDFVRDDIVVFQSSNNSRIVKRVIGLPGEKMSSKDGQLMINDSPYQGILSSNKIEQDTGITLGVGEYYVLGDNLASSTVDSRKIGAVKSSQMIGKVVDASNTLVKFFNMYK